MKKILTKEYDEDNIYLAILSVLKPISPFSKLNNQEIKVLAKLLKIYNSYLDLSNEERDILVTDYKNRVKIADELGINTSQLYNIFSSLRKKNIMVGKSLSRNILFTVEDSNSITFEFNLKKDA